MDFYQRTAVVCKFIPFGKVATYGQIALLCGKPGNARQVGYAFKKKISGMDLPAYRVVNHQGYLVGAKMFEAPDMQKRLLEAEGIWVSVEDRVNLKEFGWKNTLDEALELRDLFQKLNI